MLLENCKIEQIRNKMSWAEAQQMTKKWIADKINKKTSFINFTLIKKRELKGGK